MWNVIKTKWVEFEAWLDSWLPDVKTKIVVALGALGDFAFTIRESLGDLTGINLGKYITPDTVTAINVGLFAVAYWFRGLDKRVEALQTKKEATAKMVATKKAKKEKAA
jgi:hypothetical protein